MRDLLELVLVLAGTALLYAAGSATTPFYTKGEPREALVAREILRTGEWIVPRRPDGRLTRKPPLYYWLAAAATTADPTSPERAARLPSIAGGVVGVGATWATARAAFGPAAGLPAALVLATSIEWIQCATRARVDMTLAAPLAVLLFVWVQLTRRRSAALSALAVLVATAACLAKGPVAIVLPALAATIAWLPNVLHFGLLRFVIPLVLATLFAGVWYALAYLDQGQAFVDIVVAENLGRFLDAQAVDVGHRHGVGYLFGLALVGLLPWTPILPLAASTLRELRWPPIAMLWAWALVVPAFFSVASGKRVEYLLPMFPAVAALLGAGLATVPGPRVARVARVGALLYAPGLALLTGALLLYASGIDPAAAVARWLTPRDAAMMAALAEAGVQHAVVLFALAAASLGVAFVVERRRRREDWRGLALWLGVLLMACVGVFQATLHPAVARTQGLRDFFHVIGPTLPAGEPVYAFAPIDQQIRFYGPARLEGFPREGLGRPGLVLAWESEVAQRRDADGNPLEVIARDRVSSGRRGPLCLVRVPPGPIEPIDHATRPQTRSPEPDSERVVDPGEHREPLGPETEIHEREDLGRHDAPEP